MIAVGKVVVVVVAVAVIVFFFLAFLICGKGGFWEGVREYSKLKYRREGRELFRFSVLGGGGAEF